MKYVFAGDGIASLEQSRFIQLELEHALLILIYWLKMQAVSFSHAND